MSRTSLGLCGVLFLSFATYGCGSDDSSNTDAAVSLGNDGGDQSETGTGVGRGRGGGGLEEADSGLADAPKSDAAVGDASVPKLDAMGKLDAAPAVCEMAKCDDIKARYQTALTAAQGCRSTATGQCTVEVASALGCGGCSVWVNTDASLKVIAKEWSDSGCGSCSYICPRILIVCPLLGNGFCQKNGTTAPASVTAIGTVPIIDPGIIINLNDGMCVNKRLPVVQPL